MGERLTKLVKLVYVTAQDSPITFLFVIRSECFVLDVFSRQLVLGVSLNTLLLLSHVKPKHEHWLIHLNPTLPPLSPSLSLPLPPFRHFVLWRAEWEDKVAVPSAHPARWLIPFTPWQPWELSGCSQGWECLTDFTVCLCLQLWQKVKMTPLWWRAPWCPQTDPSMLICPPVRPNSLRSTSCWFSQHKRTTHYN